MSTKITNLTALNPANIDDSDVFVLVDVSDSTMAPSGTDKKMTWASIKQAVWAGSVQRSILGSDFTTASTTMVDVTSMSASLIGDAVYRIELFGEHQTTSTAEAMFLSVNGSAGAASLMIDSVIYSGVAAISSAAAITAFDGSAAGVAANGPGTTSRPCVMSGVLVNGASDGTLQLRMRTEVGGANTSTLKQGTTLLVTRIG